jgi:uncharacterized membrane protein YdcZ (DUF606 family)
MEDGPRRSRSVRLLLGVSSGRHNGDNLRPCLHEWIYGGGIIGSTLLTLKLILDHAVAERHGRAALSFTAIPSQLLTGEPSR